VLDLEPVTFSLERQFWIAAAELATKRQRANDSIRRSERNRGSDKNFLNDLQGVVGEVLAVLRFQSICPGVIVEHSLFYFAGPVDDVDLKVCTPDWETWLEAKCLFLEPNKAWFLFNATAHKRSLARNAHGFVPVITSVGSPVARVGRVIEMNDLEFWERLPFQYGDPAIGRKVSDVAMEYFGTAPAVLRGELERGREGVISLSELRNHLALDSPV